MNTHENNLPSSAPLSPNPLPQSYTQNPIAWCQELINAGISGRYGDPKKMVPIIGRGAALGLDPFTSLESIYIVEGQTGLGVDLMLALVERSGLLEDKHHKYTGEGEKRVCTVYLKRINRTQQDYSFSFAEGRLAGLVKPGGGWVKYPDSMLYSRAMSFGLRREFPDVLKGVHSYEELYTEPSQSVSVEVKPEVEKPAEEVEKPALPVQKRRRRTKAEMEEARNGKPLVQVLTEEPIQILPVTAPDTRQETDGSSSPPVSSDDDSHIDIDKAIPEVSTPLNELIGRALNSSVALGEVLMAAKILRLAFTEEAISQVPEEKIKRLLQHWPVVLGTISRVRQQRCNHERAS